MFEKIKKANFDWFYNTFGAPTKVNENLKINYYLYDSAKDKKEYENGFIGWVQHFDDKSACIGVAHNLLAFAEDFAEKFIADLASDEALSFLRKYLSVDLVEHKRNLYCLDKTNKNNLNFHKKQYNTKILYKKDFEEYDFNFKDMLGWEYYPNFCYATIINNKIVSCASGGYHENPPDDIIEISTITNENYRKKGYALSNVIALSEYILNMQEEKEVRYITNFDNIASQKTALSAGLIEAAKEIYFASNCK